MRNGKHNFDQRPESQAKIDRKQGITVVETLAPEQWRERISRQPPKNTYLKD
jgi:hypothetical protein